LGVLDDDGLLELVDFGFEKSLLNGLDDVAFHFLFVDVQNFGYLTVAGSLNAA